VNDLHHQDDELRDLFVDSAPSVRPDYVAARESIAHRVRRIRRRRTAGGVVAAATVVLLGSTAWAASQRNPSNIITQSPSTVASTTTTSAALPTAPAVATSAVDATPPSEPISDTTPDTSVADEPQDDTSTDNQPSGNDAALPPVVGPAQPPRPAPTTVAKRVPPASTPDNPPTTAPRPSSTTPSTNAPRPTTTPSGGDDHDNGSSGEQSYFASGGSVRVRWANNALTLLTTTPKAGWTVVTSTVSADKIEIIFGTGSQRSTLKVELDNGHPKSEHDD
jgi:hypothetical protein